LRYERFFLFFCVDSSGFVVWIRRRRRQRATRRATATTEGEACFFVLHHPARDGSDDGDLAVVRRCFVFSFFARGVFSSFLFGWDGLDGDDDARARARWRD